MEKLPETFYKRKDVLIIAKDLLGKLLVTRIGGQETIGRIVEVEAYNGVVDKASHAYGGRRTARTEIIFGPAGTAYVYLCYGIHHLFNVVTNSKDIPHAILIRAIEPVKGIELMMKRLQKVKADYSIGRGPGNVSKALGIRTSHTGESLSMNTIFIAKDNETVKKGQIVVSTRIGVDYAEEDALLPYRFYLKDNLYVSGIKNKTPKH